MASWREPRQRHQVESAQENAARARRVVLHFQICNLAFVLGQPCRRARRMPSPGCLLRGTSEYLAQAAQGSLGGARRQIVERATSLFGYFEVFADGSRPPPRFDEKQDDVVAGEFIEVRIDADELGLTCELHAGFFLKFSSQGVTHGLAMPDAAPREMPARPIRVPDQEDAAVGIDDQGLRANCHDA